LAKKFTGSARHKLVVPAPKATPAGTNARIAVAIKHFLV
jgi:hypothetical protein